MLDPIHDLTLGVCNVNREDMFEFMRVHQISPANTKTIIIPIEQYITLILRLKVSDDRTRAQVFERYYIAKVGKMEVAYKELENVRKAIPVLQEEFYKELI